MNSSTRPDPMPFLTSPDRAPWFTCLLEGPTHVYSYANDVYRQSFGEKNFDGRSVFEIMPECEGQEFFPILNKVFHTGEAHHGDAPIILGDRDECGLIERRVQYTYSPVRNRKGQTTRIMVEGRMWGPPRGGLQAAEERLRRMGPKALNDQELLGVFLNDGGEDRSGALLHRFGTLAGVFSASPADFERLRPATPAAEERGLKPLTVLRLRVARELHRRVLHQRVAARPLLGTSRLVRSYLKVALANEPREHFRVLFLDAGLNLIADELMSEGSVSRVAVYTREVLRRALELSASSLVLVHNHPAGGAAVSAQDRQITQELVDGARTLGVKVHDHLIVAGDATISMYGLGCAAFDPARPALRQAAEGLA